MTHNNLKSRVMEMHLSSLVLRKTTHRLLLDRHWSYTHAMTHLRMRLLWGSMCTAKDPCRTQQPKQAHRPDSEIWDTVCKLLLFWGPCRGKAEGSCFQTGKHPHHKYLVNDACVVTTATHGYRLVMTGHTNLIWSLAKNSADGTSQWSDLNNISDLPAVCTEPQIEIRGGCDSRGRAGHPLIGKSVVRHIEVSFGKILNPKLLPMAVPSVCDCVFTAECGNIIWGFGKEVLQHSWQAGWHHKCMNVHVKALWVVGRLKSAPLIQLQLSFRSFLQGQVWAGWCDQLTALRAKAVQMSPTSCWHSNLSLVDE